MDSPGSWSEWLSGMAAVNTGLGLVAFALFPLAIPIVALTIVALLPLALPLVVAAMLAGTWLGVRALVRAALPRRRRERSLAARRRADATVGRATG